jgi:hypothetical protein
MNETSQSTNGKRRSWPIASFSELARRQKAAVVAIATSYGRTIEEVISDPQLAAWATSLWIESNRQMVPLDADVPLHVPKRFLI